MIAEVDRLLKTAASCPGCDRCNGSAGHHWVTATESDGLPVFECKHCAAVLEVLDDSGVEWSGFPVTEFGWRRCIHCKQKVTSAELDLDQIAASVTVCNRTVCQFAEAIWRDTHSGHHRDRELVIETDARYL